MVNWLIKASKMIAGNKRGGQTTFKRYGREHMREISRKGVAARRTPEYLSRKRGYRSWHNNHPNKPQNLEELTADKVERNKIVYDVFDEGVRFIILRGPAHCRRGVPLRCRGHQAAAER